MDVIPEAVILVAAPIVAFLNTAIARAVGIGFERWEALVGVALGIVIAVLVYLGGLVSWEQEGQGVVIARAILAGIVIGMAAARLPQVIQKTVTGEGTGNGH